MSDDKPGKDDWRDAIAAAVLDQAKAAAFTAPAAQGYQGPLPEASIESRGTGNPRLGAALAAPIGDGTLSLSGDYHRRNPQATPSWGLMGTYRKQF